MKRCANLLIVFIGLFYACNISISPNPAKGAVGDTLNFKVIVNNIHLPCLLAISATEFKLNKVSLVKETDWDTINSVTFEKTITVQLNDAGKGEITISRTCPIRTSEAKVTIDIKGKDQLPETGHNLSEKLQEAKKYLMILSKGDTLSLNKLKSLQKWLLENLPKTNQTETQKIKQFLAQLDKVLAIADSLKKAAQEAIKSEILR